MKNNIIALSKYFKYQEQLFIKYGDRLVDARRHMQSISTWTSRQELTELFVDQLDQSTQDKFIRYIDEIKSSISNLVIANNVLVPSGITIRECIAYSKGRSYGKVDYCYSVIDEILSKVESTLKEDNMEYAMYYLQNDIHKILELASDKLIHMDSEYLSNMFITNLIEDKHIRTVMKNNSMYDYDNDTHITSIKDEINKMCTVGFVFGNDKSSNSSTVSTDVDLSSLATNMNFKIKRKKSAKPNRNTRKYSMNLDTMLRNTKWYNGKVYVAVSGWRNDKIISQLRNGEIIEGEVDDIADVYSESTSIDMTDYISTGRTFPINSKYYDIMRRLDRETLENRCYRPRAYAFAEYNEYADLYIDAITDIYNFYKDPKMVILSNEINTISLDMMSDSKVAMKIYNQADKRTTLIDLAKPYAKSIIKNYDVFNDSDISELSFIIGNYVNVHLMTNNKNTANFNVEPHIDTNTRRRIANAIEHAAESTQYKNYGGHDYRNE